MEAMQSALKSVFTNPVFIPYIAVTSLAFHAVTSLTLHGDSLSSQTGSAGAMVFHFVPFQTCQQHLRLGSYAVEPLLKYTPKKEFMESFEESKATEQERIRSLEGNVMAILEHISQSMVQLQHLPTPGQFEDMQADLAFKQEEMEKSEATAKTLDVENTKLQQDLVKVEELDGKITSELASLKDSISTMTREIEVFADLQGLQSDEEEKKRLLTEEKERLVKRKEAATIKTQTLAAEYESAKAQLEGNDTHTQLGNLQKKWQHHEQNNFVMKEYIAARQTEGNYQQVAAEVASIMEDYNTLLCQSLSGVVGGAS